MSAGIDCAIESMRRFGDDEDAVDTFRNMLNEFASGPRSQWQVPQYNPHTDQPLGNFLTIYAVELADSGVPFNELRPSIDATIMAMRDLRISAHGEQAFLDMMNQARIDLKR